MLLKLAKLQVQWYVFFFSPCDSPCFADYGIIVNRAGHSSLL
jgi:hypothetical protein